MATSDFLPFATGAGANVETQAAYAADATTTQGLGSGTATSAKFNKIWRQAAFMAAVIGQFIVDELAENVTDDGNLAGKTDQLTRAIQKALPTAFPSGTSMLFRADTPPTGWTQDVDINDRVLRIVNDATGNTVGGNWMLSGITVNGHSISIDEMTRHRHVAAGGPGTGDPVMTTQGNFYGNTNNYLLSGGGFSDSGPLYTSYEGGGLPHAHDLTMDGLWRPEYVNIISATKD